MQPKTIFFDFDGVLLDTIEAKGRAISLVFEKYGTEIKNKAYNYHLNNGGMNRRIKIQECYKQFLGYEIKEDQLEVELKIVADEMKKELLKCKPVNGALAFMKNHKTNLGKSWIVSAAPEDEIKSLAQYFGFATHVNGVFGFPNKKTEVIGQLIQSQKLNPNTCLMIGDAKEDFIAANNNHISFLLRKTPFSSFALDYTGISIHDFSEASDAIQKLH